LNKNLSNSGPTTPRMFHASNVSKPASIVQIFL